MFESQAPVKLPHTLQLSRDGPLTLKTGTILVLIIELLAGLERFTVTLEAEAELETFTTVKVKFEAPQP